MKPTDETTKIIKSKIIEEELLNESLAEEIVSSLKEDKPVKWNLLLSKQFESEKESKDEANT